MKINNRRLILISGLALAIDLSGALAAEAAGIPKRKTVRVAQTPLDLNSTPVPAAPVPGPTPAPGWTPTPLDPPPVNPSPSPGSSSTAPSAPGGVITAPMPMGTKPNLSPAERPPLGMFYGEQDRLDGLKNPDVRRRPVSTTPPTATLSPPAALPLNSNEVVLTPIPDSGVEPDSAEAPAPLPTGADRFGFAPPPGTLGQTYKRRSRVIEDTKHPRVGAVEVNLPEEVDVTAVGLKTKWTGKVWRLESDALLPGIPHIYEIKASWGDGTEPQVRTIRLIMGRIVDLDF